MRFLIPLRAGDPLHHHRTNKMARKKKQEGAEEKVLRGEEREEEEEEVILYSEDNEVIRSPRKLASQDSFRLPDQLEDKLTASMPPEGGKPSTPKNNMRVIKHKQTSPRPRIRTFSFDAEE